MKSLTHTPVVTALFWTTHRGTSLSPLSLSLSLSLLTKATEGEVISTVAIVDHTGGGRGRGEGGSTRVVFSTHTLCPCC